MNTILSAFLMVAPLDAPSVDIFVLKCELSRFPTLAECRYQIQRADEHLVWVNDRIRLTPVDREVWLYYRQQVLEWQEVWSQLAVARAPPTILYDWERLKYVRRAVGEENYRRGFVYPPVAEWLATRDRPEK